MSKRSNRNIQRRQVRRALNAAGDTIGRVGSHRIMNINYGQGINRGNIRFEQKALRREPTPNEVFY